MDPSAASSGHIAADVTEASSWCLEGYVDDTQETWRTLIHKLPFLVGRHGDSDLVLPFGRISQRHAKLYMRHNALWLSDLGSTNGTFVNGKRLRADQEVQDGDVVHFADHEFRLVSFSPMPAISVTQTLMMDAQDLPSRIGRSRNFREMLEENRVRALFQPLVRISDGWVLGYEVLGRSELAGVETLPVELFYIAESLGLELELSAAFRVKGLEEAAFLPGDPKIFLNTHPAELREEKSLLTSLQALRENHPDSSLILEIHEAAVADIAALQSLRLELEKLDIGIAFDDFGTGQARLLELVDLEPQYVKFDRAWIKDLHRATRKRREMIGTLTRLVLQMGIATIAEGIECREEADVCQAIGFQYAQGYFFGRPSPPQVFSSGSSR